MLVGPYDLRGADGITESCHKNRIYCIAWNFTEFVIIMMNESNKYELVSVNIKLQNDYLNTNSHVLHVHLIIPETTRHRICEKNI